MDEGSHEWSVTDTAARLLLLTYNLWTHFVRVVKEQGLHTEAVTSRDELLLVPAKLVEGARQKPSNWPSEKPIKGSNAGWPELCRRWSSSKPSSAIFAGTIRSTPKIGWLMLHRDEPTAGFKITSVSIL